MFHERDTIKMFFKIYVIEIFLKDWGLTTKYKSFQTNSSLLILKFLDMKSLETFVKSAMGANQPDN